MLICKFWQKDVFGVNIFGFSQTTIKWNHLFMTHKHTDTKNLLIVIVCFR